MHTYTHTYTLLRSFFSSCFYSTLLKHLTHSTWGYVAVQCMMELLRQILRQVCNWKENMLTLFLIDWDVYLCVCVHLSLWVLLWTRYSFKVIYCVSNSNTSHEAGNKFKYKSKYSSDYFFSGCDSKVQMSLMKMSFRVFQIKKYALILRGETWLPLSVVFLIVLIVAA